jgi:hypothetical protein
MCAVCSIGEQLRIGPALLPDRIEKPFAAPLNWVFQTTGFAFALSCLRMAQR